VSAHRLYGLAAALALLGAGSCTPNKLAGSEVFSCPDGALFTEHVSEYMERRCGTLDCHGSPARPMRLYGQFGLRHPTEENVSGGSPTTQLEREDNYGAVCGVEPEKTDEIRHNGSASTLLVVTKARGTEGHKGGHVIVQNSPEDLCISGWLSGSKSEIVAPACEQAIKALSP
jgi:hypothetical protein